jgi:RNA polymerase sigma factor (TIGR02999 family)
MSESPQRRSTDELLPSAYEELRRIAARYLRRERPGHTLQATALVHECLMRISSPGQAGWEDRAQFLRAAARVIRHTLVDHAKSRNRIKRGGKHVRIDFDEALLPVTERDPSLILLDDALTRLAQVDERKSKVVELRFFGGLTADETAQVLDVSTRTIERDWRLARAWLQREMQGSENDD